ncbi:Hypothetical predicted protein [Mytilus galloprovincialis]|uniref:Mutator-like transposase domain-containing protein n=1 Tax=Mytilus galloprovincialis TaxID=29158 RepID=A0A8B6HB33_MYTGA|nr:Hypothetical predicted protein [Mytilus galloprovincialis]
MSHGFYVSGILPNQYSRFCQASNIGTIGETTLNSIFQKYAPVVSQLVKESYETALLEEIASYEELQEGIDIVTDARHGTRKNSMYTDVVCLGARTHKVLRVETISKVDCTSAQKHELIGTERIYEYFKNLRDEYEVKIRVHCHDRNTSVNKFIRINGIDTESTNDTWHATKNIAKEIKTICSGPRYKEGQTWHPELSDKAASIKTHLYWAMKNCNKDPVKLKLSLLNIVEHYKNNHEHCSELSRCKTDSNYEPTKYLIKDPKAEMLLGRALMNTQVYKSPTDYVHCMDSYYVESFNNAILQYHDKRINFSKQVYILRTNLAVLDWNEHVNRQTTSLKTVQDAKKPRRQVKVKILKRKSYNMWSEIWDQLIGCCWFKKQRKRIGNINNYEFDKKKFINEIKSLPAKSNINWTELSRKYEVKNSYHKFPLNAGQVLYQFAKSEGVEVNKFNDTKRISGRDYFRRVRRAKHILCKRLSTPTPRPAKQLKKEVRELLQTGDLDIGVTVAPKVFKSKQLLLKSLNQSSCS